MSQNIFVSVNFRLIKRHYGKWFVFFLGNRKMIHLSATAFCNPINHHFGKHFRNKEGWLWTREGLKKNFPKNKIFFRLKNIPQQKYHFLYRYRLPMTGWKEGLWNEVLGSLPKTTKWSSIRFYFLPNLFLSPSFFIDIIFYVITRDFCLLVIRLCRLLFWGEIKEHFPNVLHAVQGHKGLTELSTVVECRSVSCERTWKRNLESAVVRDFFLLHKMQWAVAERWK